MTHHRQKIPVSNMSGTLACNLLLLMGLFATLCRGDASDASSHIRPDHHHHHQYQNYDPPHKSNDGDIHDFLVASDQSSKHVASAHSGRFAHITDMHLDLNYLPFSTISSSCHRLANPTNETDLAGPFGAQESSCDSPSALVDVALQFVKDMADRTKMSTISNVSSYNGLDFIIWTGDNARHDSDAEIPRTRSEMLLLNKVITTKLLATFDIEQIPIIPTIGNNDVYPHNSIMHYSSYLKDLGAIWKPFIPKSQRKQFRRHGNFLHYTIPGKLATFSLNTLDFFVSNEYATDCNLSDSQGATTLKFLKNALKETRREKITVLVIGHVPPSDDSWYPHCRSMFVSLMNKNPHVLASFYGHVNVDHFVLADNTILSDTESVNLVGQLQTTFLLQSHHEQLPNINLPSIATSSYTLDVRPSRQGRRVQAKAGDTYWNTLMGSYSDAIASVKEGTDPNSFHLSLVSPSVVANYYPSVRIFSYSTDSQTNLDELSNRGKEKFGELLGYDQYFLNLTNINYPPTNGETVNEKIQLNVENDQNKENPAGTTNIPDPLSILKWEIEYTTYNQFQLKSLSTLEYLNLAERIVNSSETRDLYRKYFFVSTREDNSIVIS